MSDSSNKVSIIMPVFNRKEIVHETIDSILNQTYENWELVVVDDLSTDGTYKYLLEIKEKEPRIHIFQRNREPKGAPTCRNIGIEKSTGNYAIFLDSDDLLAPSCLEQRVYFALQQPEIDFFVFPAFIFHKTPGDSEILWNIDKKKDDFVRFLDLDAPWQTSATFWKREAILKNGFWDERLTSWQDMDYHTRALIKGFKYKKINIKPEYYYRLDNKDKISSNDKEVKQLYARILIGENMYIYLQERNKVPKIYMEKMKWFFLWISFSFIKKKHFEGVEVLYETLLKLKVINIFKKKLLLSIMRINYYFFYTSYNKKIGKLLKEAWYRTFYEYYMKKIPPIDCTVKLIKYESDIINENYI